MTLEYTHAIVARISNSFKANKESFDLSLAKNQHKSFCDLLREIGLDVIELPPDDDLPESVFVEAGAIICNGLALKGKSCNPTRQKEADSIAIVLKKELNIPVEEIHDENTLLNGGDVLFTGREFFVGISEVTNEAGGRVLARTFPEYPVTAIKVGGPKCLKYYVTMAGPDVLCVSNSKICQEIVKHMEREATYSYHKITLPEEQASNVLYVNGILIHRSPSEIYESYKIMKEKIDIPTRNVDLSEFSQLSNGLTSVCLLFRRWKSIRTL